MKTSTKWIIGIGSSVIVLVFITILIIGILFFRNTGATGYSQKQAEVESLSKQLIRNSNIEATEVDIYSGCSTSTADEIGKVENGRIPVIKNQLSFDSIDAANKQIEDMKAKLENAGYKVSDIDIYRFRDVESFSAVNSENDIAVIVDLWDYSETESGTGALAEIMVKSDTCYRD